jgi:hypothetical protein
MSSIVTWGNLVKNTDGLLENWPGGRSFEEDEEEDGERGVVERLREEEEVDAVEVGVDGGVCSVFLLRGVGEGEVIASLGGVGFGETSFFIGNAGNSSCNTANAVSTFGGDCLLLAQGGNAAAVVVGAASVGGRITGVVSIGTCIDVSSSATGGGDSLGTQLVESIDSFAGEFTAWSGVFGSLA